MATATTARERRNWLIHSLYVRSEHEEALKLIEEQLRACGGLCEYALYVKGLILRQQGALAESLQLFQAALALNPRSPANLKQVARSLFLAGRHRAAIDVYREAEKADPDDWEVPHATGVCHLHLGAYAEAESAFVTANSIARHTATFLALAKAQLAQGDLRGAAETYADALEYTPDSPEVLTALGLLYYHAGDRLKAFEQLGASLTHNPRDARTVLAAGALIQEAGDFDVALVKYRVAAVHAPNSAQLWNNVGMCFFGRGKHVAAVACLKRAQYLDPFQWAAASNLGLVHLHTAQYASAFHYFNAAANLRPDHAETLMHLAITLGRLDDPDNARAAFDKAVQLAAVARGAGQSAAARGEAIAGGALQPHVLHLNYCVCMARAGAWDVAKTQWARFEALWQNLPAAAHTAQPDVAATRAQLQSMLGEAGGGGTKYPGSPTASAATVPAAPVESKEAV